MKIAKHIIKGILIIAFFQGFIETYLKISPETSRLIYESAILIMLFIVSVLHFKELKFPGLPYILIFIFISVLSLMSNHSPLLMLLIFLRRYLFGIIFFYLILNVKLSEKDLLSIWELIIVLFLIQIPVALIKLITIGAAETPMIGSIANLGGSISTILPMLGTVIFASFYFFNESKKYLLPIVGFLFFGFVGLKRAIIIFLPITFLLAFIFYYLLEKKESCNFTVCYKKYYSSACQCPNLYLSAC